MQHDEKPLDSSAKRPSKSGGPPLFSSPSPWPLPDPAVHAALNEAFASGDWGRYQGQFSQQLVERLAALLHKPHVRLCSSGTVGVELALRACPVGPGDEVILGGYDFPGNFRCIEACGARPVIVDINRHHGCLDATLLDDAYSQQCKAILVSHLHSGMADMDAIIKFAAPRGITVIEDACQAPGATVDGQPAGSWGDLAVLSFGGSKLLTAGRGGCVAAKRNEHLQRIRVFADRGNDAYPLSELQAAVLLPQLERLSDDNEQRWNAANVIQRAVYDSRWLEPVSPSFEHSHRPSYYKLSMLLSPELAEPNKKAQWIAAVQAEGIPIGEGFRGFAKRSTHRCRSVGTLTNARAMADRGIVLHHPVLLTPHDRPGIFEQIGDRMLAIAKAVTN